VVVVLLVISLMVVALSGVIAQTDIEPDLSPDVIADVEEEFPDEKLVDAGITPDKFYYFLDSWFSRSSDLEEREEKVAEIKAMIEAGKYGAARKALKKYEGLANNPDEIPPEKREEARRSAAAIAHALEKIRLNENIAGTDNAEVVEILDTIEEDEKALVTAVEISTAIKTLCERLSKQDLNLYYQTCKTDIDDPKWQRSLHEDLTEEQEKEARIFFEIMSQ